MGTHPGALLPVLGLRVLDVREVGVDHLGDAERDPLARPVGKRELDIDAVEAHPEA